MCFLWYITEYPIIPRREQKRNEKDEESMRSDSDRLLGEFKACKKGQTMSTKNITSEHFLPARGDASMIPYRTWSLSPMKKNGKVERKNVL